ncbi:hypothetical protein V6N13_014645 [Hibiscus sabdariffa]|uniref:Uncharacterized protein n=1 Tax=Hibiscus sabdariffa TaxID=183260 RepID=A0ABR2RVX4_9ROSI
MLKRGGGGRIILMSSSTVVALRPGFGAYAASKATVEAMVKILAKELKGTGITANCVAPGPIATEMFFTRKLKKWCRNILMNLHIIGLVGVKMSLRLSVSWLPMPTSGLTDKPSVSMLATSDRCLNMHQIKG